MRYAPPAGVVTLPTALVERSLELVDKPGTNLCVLD
jgi:hypothetical protein